MFYTIEILGCAYRIPKRAFGWSWELNPGLCKTNKCS